MRTTANVLVLLGLFLLAVGPAQAASNGSNERDALVVTFKDGHQQTFPVADVARIEFRISGKTTPVTMPAVSSSASTGHFLGRWKVGDGLGRDFVITLDRNGSASKSIGATRGTWKVENGEAHISWDDGWHDAIRKTGGKYEKVAYGPGKSFSDKPDNVADAKSLDPI